VARGIGDFDDLWLILDNISISGQVDLNVAVA